MNTENSAFGRWAGFSVCTALAIAVSMLWIDAPVAALFGSRYHIQALETVLGGIVLTAGELFLLGTLLVAARISGRSGNFSRTLMRACGASILAYGTNHLLKIVFGRPVPQSLSRTDAQLVFHFFHGNHHSSFPSGHMALLAAFAGMLWQAYPGTRPFLLFVLCLAGAAIAAGNWHYVSDIIAGAALGLVAASIVGRIGLKPKPQSRF